jgi:hypothetical protein
MVLEHYQRVIKEWCLVTGMAPWDPMDDIHVEVAGNTVGLLCDDLGRSLNVYCNLGPWDDADKRRQLLAMNVDLDLKGSFGMNPESEELFFRARIPLTAETDGTILPAKIGAMIEEARRRLHS